MINLVVATPCFGGQISVRYAASLFQLQKALRGHPNINLKIAFKDGDALITRARAGWHGFVRLASGETTLDRAMTHRSVRLGLGLLG